MPEWGGGPDRVLPATVNTDYIDFLLTLEDEDFGHECGREIAERLKDGGAVRRMAGCEVALSEREGSAIVVLWLPYWADEKMHDPGEHVAISQIERWHTAELALAALACAWPGSAVELGFRDREGTGHACAWWEWAFPGAPGVRAGVVAGGWDARVRRRRRLRASPVVRAHRRAGEHHRARAADRRGLSIMEAWGKAKLRAC